METDNVISKINLSYLNDTAKITLEQGKRAPPPPKTIPYDFLVRPSGESIISDNRKKKVKAPAKMYGMEKQTVIYTNIKPSLSLDPIFLNCPK